MFKGNNYEVYDKIEIPVGLFINQKVVGEIIKFYKDMDKYIKIDNKNLTLTFFDLSNIIYP